MRCVYSISTLYDWLYKNMPRLQLDSKLTVTDHIDIGSTYYLCSTTMTSHEHLKVPSTKVFVMRWYIPNQNSFGPKAYPKKQYWCNNYGCKQ